ncbi:MAG: efflux RND transporter permease subunit [Planctomycetota bacterium]
MSEPEQKPSLEENPGFFRKMIRWAINNGPAMNTFLVAAMLIGTFSMIVMRREVFPNFALEIVLISVPFPGATPTEVEQGICQKIESAVNGVEGVKKVTSVAVENFGYVVLELQASADVQRVIADLKTAVDAEAPNFPPTAEEHNIRQIVFRAPAISVGILGPPIDTDDPEEILRQKLELRDLAEEVRSDILELRAVTPSTPARAALAWTFQPKGAAISSAEIQAEQPYEIAVEIDEYTLQHYTLTLQGVAQMIRDHNVQAPGGTMETASQEVILRGDNRREDGQGISELPAITDSNGDIVEIGDLGEVIDGFAETTSINIVNGRPGLVIGISKTSDEDLFTVVETVQQYVAEKKVPAGYSIRTWNDISADVRDRLDLLTRNGLQGLLLVFICLTLFLELRLAFWVAMGIPVCILGAGAILLITGNSLNMLTMFAFLMALGIVVDDAIVIGENIYHKREQGLPYVKAAIEGTYEVLPSVTASVTTTIIAFLPLMFVTGVMGKFIAVMPVAVIAMLAISLVESILVLPCHLSHHENLFLSIMTRLFYVFKPLVAVITFMNRTATAMLQWFISTIYQPTLYWSLHNKPVVISSVVALFMVAIGLVMAGVAPLAFFPKIDGREINATVAFPNGTSTEFSREATDLLKQAILEIDEEIQLETGRTVIDTLYERIGEIGDALQGPTGVTSGSHVGTIQVTLVPPEERDYTTRQLIDRWRERIPKIAGAEVLRFGSPSMGPGGTAVEFKVLATEDSTQFLEEATEELKELLATKKGVKDIEDDSRAGKVELVMRLNQLGQALGLNENDLGSTIRSIYFGTEVMRLQRGRHEVKLMVRYPRDERMDREAFENIMIRDSQGLERPLKDVAEIDFRYAPSEVNRLNQRRSITISADVDAEEANAREIIVELQAGPVDEVLNRYKERYGANLSVDWEGEQAQTEESIISMFQGFGVALLAMFILLTLEFRSYIQPLIILSIIPFGWLGAILGHAIMQLDLTLFSFFGLIALTGVIVNDSIVLIDFINRAIRNGTPLFDALMQSGTRRFRPIMLTSMTTIAGVFPMLLETSLQAQVLIPMACSLIFGLATGTFLILVLVPIFYHVYASILLRLGFSLIPGKGETKLQRSADILFYGGLILLIVKLFVLVGAMSIYGNYYPTS